MSDKSIDLTIRHAIKSGLEEAIKTTKQLQEEVKEGHFARDTPPYHILQELIMRLEKESRLYG